jgi:hypothetical protein
LSSGIRKQEESLNNRSFSNFPFSKSLWGIKISPSPLFGKEGELGQEKSTPTLLFQRREKNIISPFFNLPLHPLLSGGGKRAGGKGDRGD